MERASAEKIIEAMMDRYRDLVFSICLRITGDWFAAEDLTQETFLSAWRNLDRFDGKNEKAWLARIAANRAVDYNRSAERKGTPAGEELLEAAPGREEDSPERIFGSREAVEAVARACGSMTDALRDTATDHFIRGLNASEIASLRGLPLKTVQSRIRRSRQILRNMMRKEELMP